MYRPPYAGVFATMEFPKYEFKEYPKAVRLLQADGSTKEFIVQDAREELGLAINEPRIQSKIEDERDELVVALVAEQDAKAKLETQLAEMQAQIAELMAAKPKPMNGIPIGAKV